MRYWTIAAAAEVIDESIRLQLPNAKRKARGNDVGQNFYDRPHARSCHMQHETFQF